MGANQVTRPALALALSALAAACQPMGQLMDELEFAGAGSAPGRKLVVLPDTVWKRESCEARPLPYLRLERSDVRPKQARAGEEVIYRLAYVACVPPQPGYLLGKIQTRIAFEDRLLSERADANYPVETGKWVVNTKIEVPAEAQPGRYVLSATVSAAGGSLKDEIGFEVVE
jgi:hypothetical protein